MSAVQVSETCSCGGVFTFLCKDPGIASAALVEWRTNHRHKESEPEVKPAEHTPTGGNFAVTERKHDSTAHELDTEFRPGPYGRGISLKWHES